MAFVSRGRYPPTRAAILLVLMVILACSGSRVIALGQDTIKPKQVRALKSPSSGRPNATSLASSLTENESHTLSLNKSLLSPTVTTTRTSLVQVIETSEFSPPSPDPTGITYIPLINMLLMSDAEVNETRLYTGVNLFEIALSGALVDTSSTTASSWLNRLSRGPVLSEPTGLALNPDNGHLFITDDQALRIFDMNPGADGIFGTADDIITSFYRTADFGSHDPEGIAFDSRQKTLYIADGPPGRVHKIAAGANDFFDGPPPAGDDQVTQFDTDSMGLQDPEGIAFNPASGTLYLVGRDLSAVLEITTGGALVREIDVSFLNPRSLSGVAYAPGSMKPTVMNLYITDRGVDNNVEPGENDGRVYEVSLTPLVMTPTSSPIDIPTIIPLRRLYRVPYEAQ